MWIPDEALNLEATLDSGQVFGFTRKSANLTEGVIGGRRIALVRAAGGVDVRSADENSEIPVQQVRDFFDLDRDLGPVYEAMQKDPRLAPSLERYRGLRVIRQEPWEALAAFIISANNHQKRIQQIWRNLSARFGARADHFPAFGPVARSSETELRALGLGYRAPYLLASARLVEADPGRFYAIRGLDYEEAKEAVRHYPGVGEKVADCVLLFGFQKTQAFPVDVWIWRAMRKRYFAGRRVTERRVGEYARRKWREWAGYVQQYVFHAARNGLFVLAVALISTAAFAETPDGMAKVYDDEGHLQSEITYRDNLPDGRYRLYHENGALSEEGTYVEGELDGIVKNYDAQGNLDTEGEYREGKIHGEVRKFFPNGTPSKLWTYRHGLRHGLAETYYPSGKIFEEAEYAEDRIEGTLKRYFENGNIQEEVAFKGGAADGPSRSYYDDGVVQAERTYKADRMEGACRLFGKNGKILAEVRYRDGTLDGTARFFDDEGKPIREEHYRAGARVD